MGDAKRRQALLGDAYGEATSPYPRRSGADGAWCLCYCNEGDVTEHRIPFPSVEAVIRKAIPDISWKELKATADRYCQTGGTSKVEDGDITAWVTFCEDIPYQA